MAHVDLAEKRKESGLCVYCGKPAAVRKGKTITRCEECEAKHLGYSRAEREQRRSAGMCIICGKAPIYGKTAQCFGCLRKRAEYYGRYYHEKKAREATQKW